MQLTTSTKKRFHHWVRACAFEMNGMPTSMHLNVIPFESFSMLLGMEWLYLDRTKVDCYDKSMEYFFDNEE